MRCTAAVNPHVYPHRPAGAVSRHPDADPRSRAGDRDRERTAALLGQGLAQGYLDLGEYEGRLDRAFAAQTIGDLRLITEDLPVATLRHNDPRRQAARRLAARRSVQWHLAGYLAMAAIVLTVWLVVGLTAGSWYFWPVWPILGAGIGLVAHAVSVTRRRPVSRSSLSAPIGRWGAGPVIGR